ncbi:MAG: efflux transporter outer membrane subunit [Acidobacteriota bacterium]
MSRIQRAVRSAPSAALLLLAAGCATAPPSSPPVPFDVPDSYASVEVPSSSPVTAIAAESAWWRSFGDPTLESLVEEALSSNQDLVAAAARVDSAVARARLAGAAAKPSASASFDGSRARQNFIGLPIPGSDGVLSTTTTTFGASLNVSWEIDLWGRLRAMTAGARSQVEASRAELVAARESIAAQTAKAWFAVLDAQRQLHLAESELQNRKDSSERIRRRYERGLRSALDLRLAISAEAGDASLVPARRLQLAAARRQLEVLVGRYPAGEVEVPAAESLALPPAIPAGLPSDLLLRRPDLVAAEQRVAVAGYGVAEARASLYPRLSLTGSAGRSSDDLSDLVDSDFSIWRLAGNLLQPVFQGGRLRAGVELAEAQQREAVALWGQAVQRAFAEVEAALTAEALLADQMASSERAATEAEGARRLAAQRYDAGLVDYLAVLETERAAFQARRQLLTARRQRLDARADLHLALGGGFEAGAGATAGAAADGAPQDSSILDPTSELPTASPATEVSSP